MGKKFCVSIAGEVMKMDTAEALGELLGLDIIEKDIRNGLWDEEGVYIEESAPADKPKVDKPKNKGKNKPTPAPVSTTPGYPAVGSFSEQKLLKKAIKKMSDADLIAWAAAEGLTWKHNDHAAILRMRVAMAINELHFPKAAPKSKAKYADYPMETLIQMASEAELEYKPTDDQRILRMRVIMALKEAGYLAS